MASIIVLCRDLPHPLDIEYRTCTQRPYVERVAFFVDATTALPAYRAAMSRPHFRVPMPHLTPPHIGETDERAPARSSVSAVPAPWNLHYHRDAYGNFGDDLNPWLFARLLPNMISPRATTALVGIGTILNSTLPSGPKLIVGSGVGYDDAPRMDASMHVHFVRGPGTAAALGLPLSRAITDPAYLATRFLPPRGNGGGGTILLPHHVSAFNADWKRVARRAGMRYVDPAAGPLRVIDEIRNARLVITSAMHGAILADAFRVPWVRVAEYGHLNEFKWKDWSDSVRIAPVSHTLPSLRDRVADGIWPTLQRHARRLRRHGRTYRDVSVTSDTMHSSTADVNEAVSRLRQLDDLSLGTLSSDSVLHERMEQLVNAFHQLIPKGRTGSQAGLVP